MPYTWMATVLFFNVFHIVFLNVHGSMYLSNSAVAHSIYGVAQSINSANYIYFLALEKTAALGHPKGVEIFTRKLLLCASV